MSTTQITKGEPFLVADASAAQLDGWSSPQEKKKLLPDAQGRNNGQWHKVDLAGGGSIQVRFARWKGNAPVFEAKGQSATIMKLEGFQSFSAAASTAAERTRGGALKAIGLASNPPANKPAPNNTPWKIGGVDIGAGAGQVWNGVKDVPNPLLGGLTPNQVVKGTTNGYNAVVPMVNQAVGRPVLTKLPAPVELQTYRGKVYGGIVTAEPLPLSADGRQRWRVQWEGKQGITSLEVQLKGQFSSRHLANGSFTKNTIGKFVKETNQHWAQVERQRQQAQKLQTQPTTQPQTQPVQSKVAAQTTPGGLNAVQSLNNQLAALNPNYMSLTTLGAPNNGTPIPTLGQVGGSSFGTEVDRSLAVLNPSPAGGGGLRLGLLPAEQLPTQKQLSQAEAQQMRASLQSSAQEKIADSAKVLNSTSGRSVGEVLRAARQRLSGEDILNGLADTGSYSLFFLEGAKAALSGNNSGRWNGADKSNAAAWNALNDIERRYNSGKINASGAKAEIKKLITGYAEVVPQQRQQVVRNNAEGIKVDRAIESTVATVAAITAPNPATGIAAGSFLRDGFNASNGQQNVTAAIGNTLSNAPNKQPTNVGKAIGNTLLGSVLPTVVDVGSARVGSAITSKLMPVTTSVAPVVGGKIGGGVSRVLGSNLAPQVVRQNAPVIGQRVGTSVQGVVTNAAAPYLGAVSGQVANQGGQFIAGTGQTIFDSGLTPQTLEQIKSDAIGTAAGIATAPVTALVDFVLPELQNKPLQRFAVNYVAGSLSEFGENAASTIAKGEQLGWGDVVGALVGGAADAKLNIQIHDASVQTASQQQPRSNQSQPTQPVIPQPPTNVPGQTTSLFENSRYGWPSPYNDKVSAGTLGAQRNPNRPVGTTQPEGVPGWNKLTLEQKVDVILAVQQSPGLGKPVVQDQQIADNVPIEPTLATSGVRIYRLQDGKIGSVSLRQSGQGDLVPKGTNTAVKPKPEEDDNPWGMSLGPDGQVRDHTAA
jgi:hypothetical protein